MKEIDLLLSDCHSLYGYPIQTAVTRCDDREWDDF